VKPLIGTANLLADQAVSLAQGYLAGRYSAGHITEKTVFLSADLKRLKQHQLDLPTSSIIDAANFLTIALRNAATTNAADPFSAARAERWRDLLDALIEHVRRESLVLNEEGHFA